MSRPVDVSALPDEWRAFVLILGKGMKALEAEDKAEFDGINPYVQRLLMRIFRATGDDVEFEKFLDDRRNGGTDA